MKSNCLYLALDFITIAIPLACSFYPKANFSKKWKYVWPSILATSIIFILWDIVFTEKGIWGFNPRYVLGIYLYNLPMEEVLFFICIPYACMFLYEALKVLIKTDWLGDFASTISIILCIFLISLGLLNMQRSYTSYTFIVTGSFLGCIQLIWRQTFLGRFFVSFLFTLVPFFIINGILTGGMTSEPVVWYNPSEMIGIRIFTIPFEDIFFGMLLLLVNIFLFEHLQKDATKITGTFEN